MIGIDLNCDLGEGTGNDVFIVHYISSAGISCGYHAGTEEDIRNTVSLCDRHRVRVGAHPSFRDKSNFGRVEVLLPDRELYDLVGQQLEFFRQVCREAGVPLVFVKPHGALYNMLARDRNMAMVVAGCIRDFDPGLEVYGLSGSVFLREAGELGLAVKHEVFADRTYTDQGSLTPRNQPGALLVSDSRVREQVLEMIIENRVTSVSGKKIPIRADTLCLHGDGAHAVHFAEMIHGLLLKNGIKIGADL